MLPKNADRQAIPAARTNRLTTDAGDAVTGTGEYKVCAARLEPVREEEQPARTREAVSRAPTPRSGIELSTPTRPGFSTAPAGSLWVAAAAIAFAGLTLALAPGMRRRKGVVAVACIGAGALVLRSAIVAADRAHCTGRRPRTLQQRMQPFTDLLTMLLAPPLR